ncbi:MAG TPA: cysteine hydrolase [Acidimicrobiales bacterium]|nr:cysteine hydrolase [Acidimicrobiales bacterium]
MPIDLGSLLAPEHSAVLTMELQQGVVGDLAVLPELAAQVRAGEVIAHAARLVSHARRAGVPVVHCTAEFRPDRAGSPVNSPIMAALAKGPPGMVVGSPSASLVPELGPEPGDFVSSRLHGVSPFTGTSLDMLLRSLGIRTVVATGVSLNIALIGLAIEAVNLGYSVAIVTDAVAGVPPEYAAAVLDNTLAMLATRVTVDDVLSVWEDHARDDRLRPS